MKENTIYYLKDKGTQVFIGDYVTASLTDKGITMSVKCIANEDTIPSLLEMGILGKRKVKDIKSLSTKEILELVEERIAARLNISIEDVKKTLDSMVNINRMAIISTFLKEIAILLDRVYTTHISESKNLFVISTFDGNIYEVDRPKNCNYKGFAAFRSFEDAKFAKDILKVGFDKVFNCEEQKDKKCNCN